MSEKGWIGVDLDGTLAHYDEWRGIEHIGKPIMPMINRVKHWLSEGREVRIFTARCDGHEAIDIKAKNVAEVVRYIQMWCLANIGQILPVTNKKDYGMVQLWDDRCVQVVTNVGEPLTNSQTSSQADEG